MFRETIFDVVAFHCRIWWTANMLVEGLKDNYEMRQWQTYIIRF